MAIAGEMEMGWERALTASTASWLRVMSIDSLLYEDDSCNVRVRYDVVITNPPFGGTETPQIQPMPPVRATATEVLVLQHIMKTLSHRHGARLDFLQCARRHYF